MKRLQITLLLIFTSCLIHTRSYSPGASPKVEITQIAETQDLRQLKTELFKLINQERKKMGLKHLKMNRQLETIAQKHSLKMAQERKMSHYFSDYMTLKKRMIKANLFFIRIGENLALSDFQAAQFIHDGFMDSSSHRKNILQPVFTHCGLGIAQKDKKIYVTQIYAQLLNIIPESEIEFLLKEELEMWFVKTFNYRFVFHNQSQGEVREIARNSIIRESAKSTPRFRRNCHQFTLIYPDLEVIKNQIKQEITKTSLEALSIGVAMGRNKKFPGGTYAVTAFLFGQYYQNLPPEELSKIILQTINQQRSQSGQSVLKLNPRLSHHARKIARTGYRNPRQHFISNPKYFTLTFPLINPQLLPAEVQEFLQKRCHEIGIGLISKPKKNASKNPFWVCLIIKRK